jgi:hypothetical protein
MKDFIYTIFIFIYLSILFLFGGILKPFFILAERIRKTKQTQSEAWHA